MKIFDKQFCDSVNKFEDEVSKSVKFLILGIAIAFLSIGFIAGFVF